MKKSSELLAVEKAIKNIQTNNPSHIIKTVHNLLTAFNLSNPEKDKIVIYTAKKIEEVFKNGGCINNFIPGFLLYKQENNRTKKVSFIRNKDNSISSQFGELLDSDEDHINQEKMNKNMEEEKRRYPNRGDIEYPKLKST